MPSVTNRHIFNGTTRGEVLVGTETADTLIGRDGADTLLALGGNDVILGGTGADRMEGGLGNDRYEVDVAGDLVTEEADAGIDTVVSGIDYTLGANLENLTLSGTGNFYGIGNAFNNVIVGNAGTNSLVGAEGNDSLNGRDGNDTLLGGAGNDTLTGGNGDDHLEGGVGNDIYSVTGTGDIIVENADEGTDTVRASASYAIGDNLENLTLTGSGNIFGIGNAVSNIITGNSGANSLRGGDGGDSLVGGAGNDTLLGEAGDDYLTGGFGNDTYFVSDGSDIFVEQASQGTDTVSTSVDFTLGDNFEILIITGDGERAGTGNALNNIITGNGDSNRLTGAEGNDSLLGGGGSDSLFGGAGQDVLTGGDGADRFQFDGSSGRDTITDFQDNSDIIDLSGVGNIDEFNDLTVRQVGANVEVVYGTAGNVLTVVGVTTNLFSAIDFGLNA